MVLSKLRQIRKLDPCKSCLRDSKLLASAISANPDGRIAAAGVDLSRAQLASLESELDRSFPAAHRTVMSIDPGLAGISSVKSEHTGEVGNDGAVDLLVWVGIPTRLSEWLARRLLVRKLRPKRTAYLVDNRILTVKPLRCMCGLAYHMPGLALVWSASILVKLVSTFTGQRVKADRRILVNIEGRLGDIARFVPTLRALRMSFPDAYIACRVWRPRGSELLSHCPYVDEVFVIGDFGTPIVRHLRALFKLISLSAYRFNLSITPTPASRVFIRYMPFMLGIKERYGPRYRTGPSVIKHTTHSVDVSSIVHKTGKALAVAKAAGASRWDDQTECFVDPSAHRAISEYIAKYGSESIVVVHPGTYPFVMSRRWPASSYAEVIDYLQSHMNARVILTGSSYESDLLHDIAGMCKTSVELAIDFFSLHEFLALIERSDLVVTNDTGPAHFAVALKRPLIAIFGPTDPAYVVGPDPPDYIRLLRASVDCPAQSSCPVYEQAGDRQQLIDHLCSAQQAVCTDAIPVAAVLEAANELLGVDRPAYRTVS